MCKLAIVLFIFVLGSFQDKSIAVKLTVMRDINRPDSVNKTISIYPAVFSSPVNNLDQIFIIVKADPIEACTRISIPEYDNQIGQGIIIVIDYEKGNCGIRRRIQMAKDIGAKGVIFMTQTENHSFIPYGDYSDLTFLVFIAKPQQIDSLILPNQYLVASLTSFEQSSSEQKSDLQLWVSPLDTKSYDLLLIWKQTMEQIPSISENVKWRPRYALWGCNSGLFTPQSDCLNAEYVSSCACKGQFCSPETKYQAIDAMVKQDIRQKLIFLNYQDQYLPYIKSFSSKCLKKFQTNFYVQDCIASVLTDVNISENKVKKDVQEFGVSCNGQIYESLLLDRNRFTQIGTYPGAFLNRSPIDFKTKKDFQVQLCRKLGLQKETGCTNVLKTNIIYSILFYLCIIVGLIVIVAGLVLLYRKTIKKWMHKEMKMQVAASVQHYFALSETK